jgi:hypothetical protein
VKKIVAVIVLALAGCVAVPVPVVDVVPAGVPEYEVVYPAGVVIVPGGYYVRGVFVRGLYRGPVRVRGGHYYGHRHQLLRSAA